MSDIDDILDESTRMDLIKKFEELQKKYDEMITTKEDCLNQRIEKLQDLKNLSTGCSELVNVIKNSQNVLEENDGVKSVDNTTYFPVNKEQSLFAVIGNPKFESITSLVYLGDGLLVLGTQTGRLFIFQYTNPNTFTQKYEQKRESNKAEEQLSINRICKLSSNKIVTGGFEKIAKLWTIKKNNNSITLELTKKMKFEGVIYDMVDLVCLPKLQVLIASGENAYIWNIEAEYKEGKIPPISSQSVRPRSLSSATLYCQAVAQTQTNENSNYHSYAIGYETNTGKGYIDIRNFNNQNKYVYDQASPIIQGLHYSYDGKKLLILNRNAETGKSNIYVLNLENINQKNAPITPDLYIDDYSSIVNMGRNVLLNTNKKLLKINLSPLKLETLKDTTDTTNNVITIERGGLVILENKKLLYPHVYPKKKGDNIVAKYFGLSLSTMKFAN